jgi:hypothetical protein
MSIIVSENNLYDRLRHLCMIFAWYKNENKKRENDQSNTWADREQARKVPLTPSTSTPTPSTSLEQLQETS